jgi:hypothetical protein
MAPLLFGEHERVRGRIAAQSAPRAERAPHAGRQRPRPWIIGLVFIKVHRASVEIEVSPREANSLADPRPLPVEEAVEHAARKRDSGAGHEPGILVGVQIRLCLLRPGPWEEAFRERVRRNKAGGEDRDRQQPMHEHRHVAPGPAGPRRKRPQDRLSVIECEILNPCGPTDGIHVRLKPAYIGVHAALGRDVIWIQPVQLAGRPALAELLKRHRGRQHTRSDSRPPYLGIPSAERVDGLADGRERLALALRCTLEQTERRLARDVLDASQLRGEIGQQGQTRERLLLGRARRQRDARPILRAKLHPSVPLPAALVDVPCGFPGHRYTAPFAARITTR